MKYSEYLGENLNNNIKYSSYLAENIDRGFAHNDYLAEQLENNFRHNDYLAEQLENNFNHNDYLAEQLERNFAHNDYLAEKLNVNFQHNDYLAEKLEQNYKHNDYLAEKLEANYNHNDYLAEQLENSISGGAINEGYGQSKQTPVNEGFAGKPAPRKKSANEKYMNSINEKLDALINSVKESVTETNFMNLLSESRQSEFASLDGDTQKMITEAMNVANVKNEAQANVVWKNVYESKKGLDIV